MLSVLEFRVQINHPRGKGKRTQNKVQFEMLLVGKPIEESTWVEGIYVFPGMHPLHLSCKSSNNLGMIIFLMNKNNDPKPSNYSIVRRFCIVLLESSSDIVLTISC